MQDDLPVGGEGEGAPLTACLLFSFAQEDHWATIDRGLWNWCHLVLCPLLDEACPDAQSSGEGIS